MPRIACLLAASLSLATGCAGNDDAAAPGRDATPIGGTAPVDAAPPVDGATVPARFRGRYAVDQAACDTPGHVSRLTIEAGTIAFHESSGQVASARLDGDTLVLEAQLGGEGDQWRATHRFVLSRDGATLTDADAGMARVRCTAR